MTPFILVLQQTYFNQGFFNVPINSDHAFGVDGEEIEIRAEPGPLHIRGMINRTANINQTARIMGRTPLRDWFQQHFSVMDKIDVIIHSPTSITLRKHE